jgi:hypothetical protein
MPVGALDLAKNVLAFRIPGVTPWVGIAFRQIGQNLIAQFFDMPEAALAHHILGQIAKEALD